MVRLRALLALVGVLTAGCFTLRGAAPRDGIAGLRRPAPGLSAATPGGRAAHDAIHLSLTSSGGDLWTVHAGVSRAMRVDLAADFSDWDPVPLAREGDGGWTVAVHVRPGVHQVAVRVDGGPWQVPAGLATLTDEFGGVAGVLVVPAAGDAGAGPGSPPGEGRY